MAKASPGEKVGAPLRAAIAEYNAIRAQIKELETQLDPLKEALLEAAVARGGQVETPTHVVKVVEQTRKTLNADRLLDAGVTPRQIERGTVETQVQFVRVDARKLE